ncbi:MAG: hypothetical protein HDT42_04325 [Ruminococcaceae bacterium]|nr:hypothetical protein [Oscillospiraceae bacterium]
MHKVSTNYEILAESPGRHVYCKIEAGGTTYLDDKIIKFEFDDVTYPEHYTIGTACSNRFSFTVRYTDALQVHDIVKPYISFDNKEWCPLGVFYVSRRYVRGFYASITCYDMMNSLDTEYVPSIQMPATAAELFRDICSQHKIPCESGDWMGHKLQKLPKGFTVREVLGFIASMAGAFAKFNREGKLYIHRLGVSEAQSFLEEENCIDVNRNLNESAIRGIRFDTGDDVTVYGEDTELTCIDVFNPLITANVASTTTTLLKNFKFYGAEIKMQGLPYIESGDYVTFTQSVPGENRKEIVMLVACEVVYTYDGSLTATLYSRGKSYSDSTVHMEDLKTAINSVRATLGNICLTTANKEDITIGSSYAIVSSFEFETAAKNTFAQVDLNFTVYTAADSTLSVRVMVNGTEAARQAVHKTTGGKRELVHYYYLADKLPKGKNIITLLLSSLGSDAKILANQLTATMIGKGTVGGDGENYRDRISFFEAVPSTASASAGIKIAGITAELAVDD